MTSGERAGVRTLRMGAAQMFTSLDVAANLAKMKHWLRAAAEESVELLLFPECALSGYAPSDFQGGVFPYDSSRLTEAAEELHRTAAETGVAAVYGSAWRDDEAGGWVNRALAITPDGSLGGWVDKVHLLGADCEYFNPGRSLEPIDLLGVRFGVGVCFDIRFPEVWRKLARSGAEVFLCPLAAHGGSAWKLPVMSAHFCSRAAENQRFLVAANSGPLQMAVSEIYDPAGIRLASAKVETEQLIWADLPLGEFEAKGRRRLPDFLSSLREDF